MPFRVHQLNGDGRQIDLLPPIEVRFDDGDVVLILRADTRAPWRAEMRLRGPLCPPSLAVPENQALILADGDLFWAGSAGHVAELHKFRLAPTRLQPL